MCQYICYLNAQTTFTNERLSSLLFFGFAVFSRAAVEDKNAKELNKRVNK
jgi:hypothetical protein